MRDSNPNLRTPTKQAPHTPHTPSAPPVAHKSTVQRANSAVLSPIPKLGEWSPKQLRRELLGGTRDDSTEGYKNLIKEEAKVNCTHVAVDHDAIVTQLGPTCYMAASLQMCLCIPEMFSSCNEELQSFILLLSDKNCPNMKYTSEKYITILEELYTSEYNSPHQGSIDRGLAWMFIQAGIFNRFLINKEMHMHPYDLTKPGPAPQIQKDLTIGDNRMQLASFINEKFEESIAKENKNYNPPVTIRLLGGTIGLWVGSASKGSGHDIAFRVKTVESIEVFNTAAKQGTPRGFNENYIPQLSTVYNGNVYVVDIVFVYTNATNATNATDDLANLLENMNAFSIT